MNTGKLGQCIIFCSAILLTCGCDDAPADVSPLTFKGTASGGTLVLGVLHDYGPQSISIETSRGESAESVASRLADAIAASHSRADCPETERLWGGPVPNSAGSTLYVAGALGDYYLAGTETGLGIPEPPVFLTCAYDVQTDVLRLAWENPSKNYDAMLITLEWREKGTGRRAKRSIRGDATTFEIRLGGVNSMHPVDVGNLFVGVVGFRNGLMSAPAAMRMKRHYQDEASAIPFARGIMPNWRPWYGNRQSAESRLKKGQRGDRISMHFTTDGLRFKPFHQTIRANPSGPIGIYRKFIGLTPGHTYRFTAGLSSLDLEFNPGIEWSFSVHATYDTPGRKGLSAEQMAGVASLPNGRRGAEATRIVGLGRKQGRRIGKESTGRGFRLLRSKPVEEALGLDDADVTLPAGVDTLIVWVRFECSDPEAEVGFLGVGIEDITRDHL